jgi:hypothetical protein
LVDASFGGCDVLEVRELSNGLPVGLFCQRWKKGCMCARGHRMYLNSTLLVQENISKQKSVVLRNGSWRESGSLGLSTGWSSAWFTLSIHSATMLVAKHKESDKKSRFMLPYLKTWS